MIMAQGISAGQIRYFTDEVKNKVRRLCELVGIDIEKQKVPLQDLRVEFGNIPSNDLETKAAILTTDVVTIEKTEKYLAAVNWLHRNLNPMFYEETRAQGSVTQPSIFAVFGLEYLAFFIAKYDHDLDKLTPDETEEWGDPAPDLFQRYLPLVTNARLGLNVFSSDGERITPLGDIGKVLNGDLFYEIADHAAGVYQEGRPEDRKWRVIFRELLYMAPLNAANHLRKFTSQEFSK